MLIQELRQETETDYIVVQSEPQLDSMIAAIEETGSFAFDTETTDLDAMRADLVGLSFATAPGRAWYVPVGHREGQQTSLGVKCSPPFDPSSSRRTLPSALTTPTTT